VGKFILYGLLVVGASSLANWTTLGKSVGSGYGGSGARGGWVGGSTGGWSSSGSGHK
jgi:hypothetical protein